VYSLELSGNALKVLRKRYLLKNDRGENIEKPKEMFNRVAKNISKVDDDYGEDAKKTEKEFFEVMSKLEFLPNSPTLMNAGTRLQQLSACFVLPIEDSIDSIFNAVHEMAKIHQSGGGTGFSFSEIRPKGDIVMSTKGEASGPVSFMTVFDSATDVIKQGGKRRGANMAVLSVYHPDIVRFITVKKKDVMNNFNLSVAVDKKFMKAVRKKKEINLINPRTKKKVDKIKARKIFDLISEQAWKKGDPGIVFMEEINEKHVLPEKIKATNPCGETPLLPYESCNLGSINLAKMVDDNRRINWNKLKKTVGIGVHFLDNVIDASKFPIPKIEKITKANRKIGLGVMGWADMLTQLRISYASETALGIAEKIMKFISDQARKKSEEIAMKRGAFPNFKKSSLKKKYKKMRNATCTTIAPTGTISIISDCSSGIEPLFAISYYKKVLEGETLVETNDYFEKIAKEKGFYSEEIAKEIAEKGTVQDMDKIPNDIKRLFMTAHDIRPGIHVKMQAAFQKYTDNAVSKTVNLRKNAVKEDVRKVFLLADKLKCKGITVYREGSKKEQVLNIGKCKECEG